MKYVILLRHCSFTCSSTRATASETSSGNSVNVSGVSRGKWLCWSL